MCLFLYTIDLIEKKSVCIWLFWFYKYVAMRFYTTIWNNTILERVKHCLTIYMIFIWLDSNVFGFIWNTSFSFEQIDKLAIIISCVLWDLMIKFTPKIIYNQRFPFNQSSTRVSPFLLDHRVTFENFSPQKLNFNIVQIV